MKYRWAIPSYQRAEEPLTVDLLNKMGYSKEEIIVSTQTEEDYKAYQKAQGDKATIIYRAGENDSMNRNTLLQYFPDGECFLLADDDIKAFAMLKNKKLRPIESREELEKYFTLFFRFCKRHNSKIWAWYPVDNAYFMKRTIDEKNILVGTIFGIENDRRYLFDEEYDLKGDYEFSLRYIKNGYNAVRFNGFTCIAKHKSKGGCEEARASGRNAGRYEALLKKYPTLIKPSYRDGEIKYVGEVKHYPDKELIS